MMNDKHILIIEDQISQAKNLKNHLNDLGYENITICRNAKEALPQIEKGAFDIALVDIGLENSQLNGISLAKKIQELHGTPIIFLTGFSDDSTIQSTLEVGFSDYLVKPVEPRQLYVSLTRAFAETIIKPVINSTSGCPFKVEKDIVFIKKNDFSKRVTIDDFSFAKADKGYVQIFTEDSQFTIPTSLKSFIQQFNNSNIVRVHQSYAVNKRKVIERNSSVLLLSNRKFDPIPIGRKYKNAVKLHFETINAD